jgi:hypothetical protein
MARKTVVITIDAEGRDKGKRYRITEMSAVDGEFWAVRALMALARAGVDIPEDAHALGAAGIASLGLRMLSYASPLDAKALMDDLMRCVRILPNPSDDSVEREPKFDGDIEELMTLLRLKKEVFILMFGFFLDYARQWRTSAAETSALN